MSYDNSFIENNTRFYSWNCIIYDKTVLGNIVDIWNEHTRISQYAFILHDKDKKEDGTLKEPHFHCLLVFKQCVSFKTLCRIIKGSSTQNIRAIPLFHKDYEKEYDYLTHEREDHNLKYHYNIDDICESTKGFFKNCDKTTTDDEINGIIDGIINKVPLRKMACLYGKDFIKNYNSYYHFAISVDLQEHPEKYNKNIINDEELDNLNKI